MGSHQNKKIGIHAHITNQVKLYFNFKSYI